MNENIIGKNLKTIREEKRISPQQLSEALSQHNITLSAEDITAIEASERPVCDIELLAFAKTLGCPIIKLFDDNI